MEAKPKTMLGDLLTKVQKERKFSREQAIKELYKRNGVGSNSPGYKLAETAVIHDDGREVTEYRLYELIDSTVTTLTAEVNMLVETGIEQVSDGKVLKRK